MLISHASKVCSKSFRLGFSSTWTKNIHCLRFSKTQRNQRSNCQHFWILKKARAFQKKIYFCFTDSAKGFDCVDHRELWNILKEMRVPDHLICLLSNPYTGHRANLELDLEQLTGSKLRKEWDMALYCHAAYFTLCRVQHVKCWPGWMASWNQDCQERYQQLQICRGHHSNAERGDELKSLLMKWKRRMKNLAWNTASNKLQSRRLVPSLHGK